MRVVPLYVLLGGWLAMPALAADEPVQFMNRLVQAESSQSFAGDFVYQRNNGFSTYSIWQRAESQHVTKRLVQLDGVPVETIRRDGSLVCATQQRDTALSGSSAMSLGRADPARLSQSYDLKVVGDSRVAGRAAIALAVIPRDQHRYGFELHLDRQSGLLAKSLLLNEQGQLLERFQFTRLDVGSVEAGQVEPTRCDPIARSAGSSDGVVEIRWHSEWIPEGFMQMDSDVRESSASNEQVAWLSYSDGLARFSVFIEPLRGEAVADARTQMGPTAIVSKRLPTEDGDVMVTVVGEIPVGTAERIALSMRSGTGLATQ